MIRPILVYSLRSGDAETGHIAPETTSLQRWANFALRTPPGSMPEEDSSS